MVLGGFLAARPLHSQDPAAETVAYEATAGWLGITPRGNVQTNSNRVDFESDLGMGTLQSHLTFRFDIKPSDRKRIMIEFIPYRFNGENTIERGFRFGGVTYNVNERVEAKASLNYISAGFEYDFVNQPRVDVGVIGAIAYLGLRAKANSPSAGEAEVDRDIGFPLAGLAARFTPSSREPGLTIRVEGKGMSFGSYGQYFDGDGALGFRLAANVTLEAGYRFVHGDGHNSTGTRGAKFNFHGPTIRLRLHDR